MFVSLICNSVKMFSLIFNLQHRYYRLHLSGVKWQFSHMSLLYCFLAGRYSHLSSCPDFTRPLLGLSRRLSKESACNARDMSLIPGWGRSPGEGNGNALQYSWLENPMDREAWQATVYGTAKSDMTEHAHTHQQIMPPESHRNPWL